MTYQSDGKDLAFPLVESCTLIGRDAGCMVQLTDELASKRHASIKKKDGRWLLEDLGSENGTRLNGEAICKATKLKHGDIVAFGPVMFKFVTDMFTGENFAPGHVIDLSPRAAQRTIRQPNSGG
jgi:pSer/pThr/pTyr-binding forkhead associated (FHA) protein